MRTPHKPVEIIRELRLPGEGLIQLGHTASGSAIELHVQSVGGARASVFLTPRELRYLMVLEDETEVASFIRRREWGV